MHTKFFALIIVALALSLSGCAAGFRAGGERGGVGVGAVVAPPAPVYVAPDPQTATYYTPPPSR
jgi:hypothetical protein